MLGSRRTRLDQSKGRHATVGAWLQDFRDADPDLGEFISNAVDGLNEISMPTFEQWLDRTRRTHSTYDNARMSLDIAALSDRKLRWRRPTRAATALSH